MVDEIKLDKLSIPLTTTANKAKPDAQKAPLTVPQGDITITDHVSKVVHSILSDNSASDQNSRVLEMKHKIESNQYSIDTHALADRLWTNVFSKSIGG